MLILRNAYTCDVCDRHIVTNDTDEGCTPMIIGCVATPDCPGHMHSHWYRGPVVASDRLTTHEFRKPTREEYDLLEPAMQADIDAGGLELYPVRTH